MKIYVVLSFYLIWLSSCWSQSSSLQPATNPEFNEDLNQLIYNLKHKYIYASDKQVDFSCLERIYSAQLGLVKTEEEANLLFEILLDEFYDSHVTLNANWPSSYRLHAPLYLSYTGDQLIVSQVWTSQIDGPGKNIIGAEVRSFNGINIEEAITSFPTACHDKTDSEVREWLANKLIAGRYNEPRLIELTMPDHSSLKVDIDNINIHQSDQQLSVSRVKDIAIVRINNALGENDLISMFDTALDSLMDTEGLILDLRNTVSGGNSYVARGIMGRFVTTTEGYQIHSSMEQYDAGPAIERRWMEYVSSRGVTYDKPVVILVGRWTGSMGEGLAIGMEAAAGATVMGTEMERLAGGMYDFSFAHRNFGYQLAMEKIYHVNGLARESYIPDFYFTQRTNLKDELLDSAIQSLQY